MDNFDKINKEEKLEENKFKEEVVRPFDQLINSYDAEKNLEKAFQEGFHFHWIAYSHSLLTEFIKSFILLDLNWKFSMGKLERSSDFKEYITSLNFRGAISFLHFNGVIPLKLYNQLREINVKRNLVLHNLIFKIEKVNGINLKNYFDLCDKSLRDLSNEMAIWAKIHSSMEKGLIKMMDDFEKKLNEVNKENEKDKKK